jgi:hypothetical protein
MKVFDYALCTTSDLETCHFYTSQNTEYFTFFLHTGTSHHYLHLRCFSDFLQLQKCLFQKNSKKEGCDNASSKLTHSTTT